VRLSRTTSILISLCDKLARIGEKNLIWGVVWEGFSSSSGGRTRPPVGRSGPGLSGC